MTREICASNPRFWGENDSETIQNAINYAEEMGLGEVVIPRRNERTGEHIWIISKTILLPSDITIILDNCHLRLADDVRENIFRNREAWTEKGNTLEGEQHDIRIMGIGHAVMDGGKPNGLCEQLHRDHPNEYPHMSVNLLIFLHNVRNFEVKNIQFIETRWWAMAFMFCRWGYIGNLDFRMYGNLENQDGVDLRIGCEYITVENITGCTGDDTVALTCLPYLTDHFQSKLMVEGKTMDIHDVTIRNIISSAHGCGLLRFLCKGGARIYNVTVDGVKDTCESISGMTILFGVAGYGSRPHSMDDFFNITIRNVTSCAKHAIFFNEPMKNVLIENVTTYGPNEIGLRFSENFECENFVLRNLNVASNEEDLDCGIWMDVNDERRLEDFHIERVRIPSQANYVMRGTKLDVEDLLYAEPKQGFFTEEKAVLSKAYGRYHKYSNGKEILNRPKDNRFDGTLRDFRYLVKPYPIQAIETKQEKKEGQC